MRSDSKRPGHTTIDPGPVRARAATSPARSLLFQSPHTRGHACVHAIHCLLLLVKERLPAAYLHSRITRPRERATTRVLRSALCATECSVLGRAIVFARALAHFWVGIGGGIGFYGLLFSDWLVGESRYVGLGGSRVDF